MLFALTSAMNMTQPIELNHPMPQAAEGDKVTLTSRAATAGVAGLPRYLAGRLLRFDMEADSQIPEPLIKKNSTAATLGYF